VSVLKHSVHPLLAAITVGLWIVSLFCDLLYLGGAEAGLWSPLALYTMVGGFLAALAAAVPRLKELSLAHVPVNLVVVSLYAVNLWLRLGDAPNTGPAIALSAIGVSILAVSSWLGEGRVRVQGVSE
jgi:uncharacterized membrane protein